MTTTATVKTPTVKTTVTITPTLLRQLKFAALEERTTVSALLCKLADAYLKTRPGGRR
jgi:hypothetical protein